MFRVILRFVFRLSFIGSSYLVLTVFYRVLLEASNCHSLSHGQFLHNVQYGVDFTCVLQSSIKPIWDVVLSFV